MTTQPEALRLADSQDCVTDDNCGYCMPCSVAAELRRQHVALVELMREVVALFERNGQLIAQRDALLEALKSTGLFLHHCWCDVQMNDYSFEKLNQQMAVVDAAIKAVEGA